MGVFVRVCDTAGGECDGGVVVMERESVCVCE